VREYAPPAGGSVAWTVTAADDFLIGRLTADLKGAKRVDLSLCDERGAERLRLADIPQFRIGQPRLPEVDRLCEGGSIGDNDRSIDDAGGERLLGEFTFNHARTLPGTGAW